MNSAGNNNANSLFEDNFLSAYHSLKFSKRSDDAFEAMDLERRCLAIRFMAAKKLDSEDTASTMLQKGLESYQDRSEKRDGVNNYWSHIRALVTKVDNDPTKWESVLKDPTTALQFLNPLPCRSDNTKGCKNKAIVDHRIKDIVDIWKEGPKPSRNRKVSFVDKIDENITAAADQRFVIDASPDRPHKAMNAKQQQRLISIERKTFGKSADNIGKHEARPNESELPKKIVPTFRTAREEFKVQLSKRVNPQKRMLGGKRSVSSKFVCPSKSNEETVAEWEEENGGRQTSECQDERLKNIEPKMVELIRNEIMDTGTPVSWGDIAGLEFAKKTIMEIVVFPLLRPDIFTGLRRPPKGILLFGPPGTGKTLIGKCIASQSKSTFFSISASCLTSKWIGEGEKMVRALFAVARVHQPAVVFIDEIDSLLSQRSESEHESSRRIKTEFLVQLDGAATSNDDRILVVGATNRPQELDEAARRRLVKRLYIPLPEFQARKEIIKNLLVSEPHDLTEEEVSNIAELSEGYSGADMADLCKEASMGPIRSLSVDQLRSIERDQVRRLTIGDFKEALNHVRASVSQADLSTYVDWDHTYGMGTALKYHS